MPNLTQQIAQHLRSVFFGGNWTSVNLKETLADINWQQAKTSFLGLNTIATLTYHMTYYVEGVQKTLKGGTLDIRDKFSFDHPPIQSEKDWHQMLENVWYQAEEFAKEIEALSEDQMFEVFIDSKYGNYYSNLCGIIEHCHYHLGQISLIKKIILKQNVS